MVEAKNENNSGPRGTRPARGLLVFIDTKWTWIEQWLAVFVLAIEIGSIVLWVTLNGLARGDASATNAGGLVFRALATSAIYALVGFGVTRFLARKKIGSARSHAIAITALAVVGLFAARLWAGIGVAIPTQILNWLQNGSVLMLVGGLRGLVTRLTLWLALIGASLATARGRHIHIDIATRFLPKRAVLPAAVIGWVFAASVALAGAVGFADNIAITSFRAPADAAPGVKFNAVVDGVKKDFFLLGRQASLDLRSLPRVIQWKAIELQPAEWNAWLDSAPWKERFEAEKVDALRMAESDLPRMPAVTVPGTGEGRGLLVRELNFVLVFGLIAIAFRALLRAARLVFDGTGDGNEGEASPAAAVSDSSHSSHSSKRAAKWGLGLGAVTITLITIAGGVVAGGMALLAFLGAPLFAIMGGSAELAWLLHSNTEFRHLRFIAPTVLHTHFSDSPILVTIPLFTFVGYLLAESKTPDRLVDAARSALGWLPGGLAIVCVLASAIFTVLTGGSGVTIVAVGGLLYPALRKQGYSERFSLGLVTTGGSVGLLLPYSLPLLVFCLVAQVDYTKTFKAVLVPGALVIVLLSAYAAIVGMRENVARERSTWEKARTAIWALKWEALIPVLLIVGLGTGLTSIDESAGIVAAYVVIAECFLYRDLSLKKDIPRIVKASMSMAGAIVIILAMANALMNYVVDQRIPLAILNGMLKLGIDQRWQFLIVLNLFLLVLGMLMEGFSAILVAVPLILPFVVDLGIRHPDQKMSPFQLAMIFLLNLEIAYSMPPLGLNLFISSFRFNRPVASLYRVVLPFVAILTFALLIVSYVPSLSTAAVAGDIARLKETAEKQHTPPREAWMLECVQGDPNNPQPCTSADQTKYPNGQLAPSAAPGDVIDESWVPDAGCNPDLEECGDAG